MKKINRVLVLLSFVVFILSCSKEDSISATEVSTITVYKNQSTNTGADALQAQHVNSKGTLNFYGNFDTDKNPINSNTLTYQKVNNDTIVHFTIDPTTCNVNSTFISVKGIKSPIVIKFDYTTLPIEIGVSFYNYNWETKTSIVIYATHVKNTNGIVSNNPYFAARQADGVTNFFQTVVKIASSFATTDLIFGGIESKAKVLVSPVAATTLLPIVLTTAAAITETDLVLNSIHSAGEVALTPSDKLYPFNVTVDNPVPITIDPTPNFQTSNCININISFSATMDSSGTISFIGVSGGKAPYTYFVGSAIQSSPVFTNNYADGIYFLAAKDADGCINTQSISLTRPTENDLTINIDTQTWMLKNLDVSKYRNGDPIPQVTNPTAWAKLTTGAWCYYENNTANGTVYGKLYNWYAVNDPRGLAPSGYHIPSDTEWTALTTFLGGEEIAGVKMKATTGWTPFVGITNTNSSGFTGLPGGYRNNNGVFLNIDSYGSWWSSTENSAANAWYRYLYYSDGYTYRDDYSKRYGFSVRCLSD